MLSYDDALRLGYGYYQDFLYAIHTEDYKRFYESLTKIIPCFPRIYQTPIDPFKKYQNEIKNALELSYSNGSLEDLNNHIKVLKRNAYGFRNFLYF
ncbi:transposase [Enterococcus plantarum]|nr:transposase [Enterococcus plantarum]